MALGGALLASAVHAQTSPPVQLDPVVVTVERTGTPSFDAPAAISVITRSRLEQAGPQVNLSESLRGVPGVTVLNRENYAQDLQLSIRGFGARSTFGIRGVRLIVDGIPATMPDGQGQASTIALGSAGRVEVLRGPLAQLYGNAAGGVVQVFTEEGGGPPSLRLDTSFGSHGLRRQGVKFIGGGERHGLVVEAARFETDGYRDHSAARRDQFNAKWTHDWDADTRITLVANALDQPLSLDPLGLTRAQWEADPRQAAAAATLQNTRKTVRQQQWGGVLERRLGENTTLTTRLYGGERDLFNSLGIPLAAQRSPTSSGGIVDFSRRYMGFGAQLAHTVPLGGERRLRWVLGTDIDRMREDRQGYVNEAGEPGDLKRDEVNRIDNRDVVAQASLDLSPTWTVTAGARHSNVRFRSDDRFIVPGDSGNPGNPDDSGTVSYSATNPVLGLSWRAAPNLNLYANAGRGFETPTFTELAYRPGGETGLNTALNASRSRHAELGLKWRLTPAHRMDVALFDIATRDEIVVDTNQAGRSTFKNAGRTSRRGVEWSYVGDWADTLRATASLTALRARVTEPFVSGSGANAALVERGNRLAGTPERNAYAELAWSPRQAAGFQAGVEWLHRGSLPVNDANTDAAPSASVINLRAGFAQQVGGWRLQQQLRLDNATDRRYAGSVIVNEGNSRFFEPALPRHWTLGLTARYDWQ